MRKSQDPTLRKCTRCGWWLRATGPAPEFSPGHSRCKSCRSIEQSIAYHEDPTIRVRQAARRRERCQTDPEYRARKLASNNTPRARAVKAAWKQTVLGRLRTNRSSARYKLKFATTAKRRAALVELIAAHDREIARIVAARAATRESEDAA